MNFEHCHAAHCESGVISSLISYYGLSISEAMAFGLAGGMTFAYIPFIKVGGFPLIAYRQPPRAIIKGAAKALGAKIDFETFDSPEAGQARLDALLDAGVIVGLQTSVFWLPYFPPDMRFHFNAHNLLVYGREGDDYLISDPVFEEPVRCASADLARARFAKGLLAPKGLLYRLVRLGPPPVDAKLIRRAIRRVCRNMLAPFPLVGTWGMRTLAKQIAKLPAAAPETAAYVGHMIRMQEEIGTGGAGFRFLYAAFLQEAAARTGMEVLNTFADRLTLIGDQWREFALKVARMIKEREPMAPIILAELLTALAKTEADFFRDLRRAVR